ncbi:MAG: SDR family oxidoreductase [Hyphomicrobiaceae bacterium]
MTEKTILITGASRGIGREVAILAGKQGWSVGINFAGDAAAADETIASVEAAGGRAVSLRGDVSNEADVLAMFGRLQETFGALDGLVNNAGILGPAMPLTEFSVERMRRIFDVNILGAFLCAREAAKRMTPGGVIVNVSSAAARLGSPNEFIDYAASKGAVDSLTIGLGKELGPRQIRVNAVRPGLIDTEMHAQGGHPDRAKELGSGTPLGRAGKPKEVAEAIFWLLNDESSYVTGTLLDVAGGR